MVFKLDPTGKETVLYAFTGGADGLGASSGLVRDEAGNLYGTTVMGGGLSGVCPGLPLPGCGVVFKLDPNGKETVLHTFTGGADGYAPYGDLLRDEAGNLYGAASNGGDVSGFCGDVVLNTHRVPRLRNGVQAGPDRKIHRAAHLQRSGRGAIS